MHVCKGTHDVYRTTRVCELAGWPRVGNRQHARKQQPRTLLGGHGRGPRQGEEHLLGTSIPWHSRTHRQNPTGGASTAHPEEAGIRKNTDVNQAAEVLVSQSRRRSNQACGQYRAGQRWPRQGSNPKTSCSGDDCNRKDTVLDKRIQGCMRQQPCALSSEQPQQLLGAAWTSVSQRHAWGRLARLLLHEAT